MAATDADDPHIANHCADPGEHDSIHASLQNVFQMLGLYLAAQTSPVDMVSSEGFLLAWSVFRDQYLLHPSQHRKGFSEGEEECDKLLDHTIANLKGRFTTLPRNARTHSHTVHLYSSLIEFFTKHGRCYHHNLSDNYEYLSGTFLDIYTLVEHLKVEYAHGHGVLMDAIERQHPCKWLGDRFQDVIAKIQGKSSTISYDSRLSEFKQDSAEPLASHTKDHDESQHNHNPDEDQDENEESDDGDDETSVYYEGFTPPESSNGEEASDEDIPTSKRAVYYKGFTPPASSDIKNIDYDGEDWSKSTGRIPRTFRVRSALHFPLAQAKSSKSPRSTIDDTRRKASRLNSLDKEESAQDYAELQTLRSELFTDEAWPDVKESPNLSDTNIDPYRKAARLKGRAIPYIGTVGEPVPNGFVTSEQTPVDDCPQTSITARTQEVINDYNNVVSSPLTRFFSDQIGSPQMRFHQPFLDDSSDEENEQGTASADPYNPSSTFDRTHSIPNTAAVRETRLLCSTLQERTGGDPELGSSGLLDQPRKSELTYNSADNDLKSPSIVESSSLSGFASPLSFSSDREKGQDFLLGRPPSQPTSRRAQHSISSSLVTSTQSLVRAYSAQSNLSDLLGSIPSSLSTNNTPKTPKRRRRVDKPFFLALSPYNSPERGLGLYDDDAPFSPLPQEDPFIELGSPLSIPTSNVHTAVRDPSEASTSHAQSTTTLPEGHKPAMETKIEASGKVYVRSLGKAEARSLVTKPAFRKAVGRTSTSSTPHAQTPRVQHHQSLAALFEPPSPPQSSSPSKKARTTSPVVSALSCEPEGDSVRPADSPDVSRPNDGDTVSEDIQFDSTPGDLYTTAERIWNS